MKLLISLLATLFLIAGCGGENEDEDGKEPPKPDVQDVDVVEPTQEPVDLSITSTRTGVSVITCSAEGENDIVFTFDKSSAPCSASITGIDPVPINFESSVLSCAGHETKLLANFSDYKGNIRISGRTINEHIQLKMTCERSEAEAENS